MYAAIDDIATIRTRINADDYIDVAQVWFPEPLTPKQLRELDANCRAGIKRAGDMEEPIEEPAWWDHRLQQFVRFCQPNKKVIDFLAQRADAYVNYLELTRDFSLPSDSIVQASLRRMRRQFVQPHHGKREVIVYEQGNYETGKGKPGLRFLMYGDSINKATGEPYCLHVEAKIQGRVALQRLCIEHPRDLLSFDVNAFWRKYLFCFDVDRERLGRNWRNRANCTRKRKKESRPSKRSLHDRFNADVDRSTGHLICRVHGRNETGAFSMQRLVNQIGRGPWLLKTSLQTVIEEECCLSSTPYTKSTKATYDI